MKREVSECPFEKKQFFFNANPRLKTNYKNNIDDHKN